MTASGASKVAEPLGRERDAEDGLLALLARGIREAAELRPLPILRVIRAQEDEDGEQGTVTR